MLKAFVESIHLQKELVKSPLNYTGGKYKLLPQILPLFPNKISDFYDVFGGGGDVTANVIAKKTHFNDINSYVVGLIEYIRNSDRNKLIEEIEFMLEKYNLSNTSRYGQKAYEQEGNLGLSRHNKEGYLKLREDFNKKIRNDGNFDFLFFLLLVFYSFNNQIRFNQKGEMNESFGKRGFNTQKRNNLICFCNSLKQKNIIFSSKPFEEVLIEEKFKKDSFVYLDPPYLISEADYNKIWNEKNETSLYENLNTLNQKGIKFALSNVVENKGMENTILKEWMKDFNVHYLKYDYRNSSYQKKDKTKGKTTEILVTNY